MEDLTKVWVECPIIIFSFFGGKIKTQGLTPNPNQEYRELFNGRPHKGLGRMPYNYF